MEAEKVLAVMGPGEWTPFASEQMQRACLHATPEQLQAQHRAGAALFYVMDGEKPVGCYLLRRDGTEGVVIGAAGDGAGVDLISAILPVIEGQLSDCASIRIHTSRPGMIRRLTHAGYEAREMVLCKVL